MMEKVYKGYMYLNICKAIYGLPQAGILANKQLQRKLMTHGYYEENHTLGLWRHISNITGTICFGNR